MVRVEEKMCYQCSGLNFLLSTGNWGKYIVAEAEVALAEVGGGGDGNPLKCPTHFTKVKSTGFTL